MPPATAPSLKPALRRPRLAGLAASLLAGLAWAACPGPARAQETAAAPAAVASAAATAEAPPAPAGPARRLPVEHFAKLPLLSDLALSPDGQSIAALMNIDDHTALVVRPVNGDRLRPVLKTDNQQFHFKWIQWVGNDRLLASVRFAARRDFVGTQETRLLSVRADGGGHFELLKTSPFGRSGTAQIQDTVVDWLPGDGRHVLLQLTEGESSVPAVFKVNVETGQRHMVHPPLRHVRRWFTDATHRVRVGLRSEDGEHEVLVCDPDGSNWRTLWSFKSFAREAVWPLGFGRNPQELYVLASHEGRDAVFTVDLAGAQLTRTLRLAHPTLDVTGRLLHSPATGEVVGVRSAGVDQGDQARTDLWDPQWRALAQAIDKGLPERHNHLLEFSRDEQRYLVHSSGNGTPGQYYLGDRATGELALLAEEHGELHADDMVGKQPVRIRARDGLALVAYLSTPRLMNTSADPPGGKNPPLPLVLLPHGGPHSRDHADFDVETEFLANRGYAVLQVNFRGSAGFGHDFMVAGLQRWGLEMQDDLTDAVQWAVAQGVADPARICIVGGSYGGYAALMGLVKTPQLYRCAASFAGVADLIDLIQHYGDYIGGQAAMQAQLGSAWTDRARLRATSPALNAARIQAPVLLVHGTADRSVPVDQSRDMASALKREGKAHRYIEQPGGDHHLSRYSHRLEYFKALEAFLAEHLALPPVR
jgi:dienelactone hydrolase